MTMLESRVPEAPEPTLDTGAYWEAARAGRLTIGRCRACGERHFYPRARCPHCLSGETELLDAEGTGTLYSFSVMRRAPVPYAIAYVALDEGVTMMTNMVNCEPGDLRIGMAVRLVFQPAENGQPVPMFEPA